MFFARMMATPVGRLVRGAVGLGILVLGLTSGGWWHLLDLVGVMVAAMALLNICVIGRLLGAPFDWAQPSQRQMLGDPRAHRHAGRSVHPR